MSYKDTEFLVLAVAARAIPVIGKFLLDDMKKQLDLGWTTNMVIIATGNEKDKHNIDITNKFREWGHDWAADRVVYQLHDETVRDFVIRICFDYNVTHFVDTHNSLIRFVTLTPPLADIRVNRVKPKEWAKARQWMFDTCPKFINLLEKEPNSFDVIKTGYTMKRKRQGVK